MSTPTTPETRPPRRRSRLVVNLIAAALMLGVAAAVLGGYGPRIWQAFREYRIAQEAADEQAPVGYVGVHLRKSYNDKPARFLSVEDGRTLLWAAKGEDGKPIFYDVTDAMIRVERLSGGFGRDSIPGIDYPIFERSDSALGGRLRGKQPVYGLATANPPRAYPAVLLRKIEVVNDRDGSTPFVIVFDRSRGSAGFYDRRIDSQEVTFGTTGYAYGKTPDPSQGAPLLYDRLSKSLWLAEGEALVCVSGEYQGRKLPKIKTPEETTWSAWRSQHIQSLVLVGNDRAKPVPSQ
jgi:hypothetical protein